ncbi:hypothetical protein NJB18091_33670 [Mycobacterium marinum]|nr:hypothetical protein NJB18091_33670 [Mycobacterium marinum]
MVAGAGAVARVMVGSFRDMAGLSTPTVPAALPDVLTVRDKRLTVRDVRRSEAHGGTRTPGLGVGCLRPPGIAVVPVAIRGFSMAVLGASSLGGRCLDRMCVPSGQVGVPCCQYIDGPDGQAKG